MAKNLPYFKFVATEWLTGDIVFEDLIVQGLFINVCALYWQRDGELFIEDIERRYKHPEEIKILQERFFSVENGKVQIKFLDEQLTERNFKSKVNSINGRKGAEAKKQQEQVVQANAKRTPSERQAIESDGIANKNKNKNKKRIRKEEEQEQEQEKNLPENEFSGIVFEQTEFQKKLIEFYLYRNEMKKKILESSKAAFLKKLLDLSKNEESEAIKILDQSIANGWQGIFPLKTENNVTNQTNYTAIKDF
jgi:hypothetical protein